MPSKKSWQAGAARPRSITFPTATRWPTPCAARFATSLLLVTRLHARFGTRSNSTSPHQSRRALRGSECRNAAQPLSMSKFKTFARADSGRKSGSFERLSAGRTRPEAEFVGDLLNGRSRRQADVADRGGGPQWEYAAVRLGRSQNSRSADRRGAH